MDVTTTTTTTKNGQPRNLVVTFEVSATLPFSPPLPGRTKLRVWVDTCNCTYCCYSFPHKILLGRHIQSIHSGLNRLVHRCMCYCCIGQRLQKENRHGKKTFVCKSRKWTAAISLDFSAILELRFSDITLSLSNFKTGWTTVWSEISF